MTYRNQQPSRGHFLNDSTRLQSESGHEAEEETKLRAALDRMSSGGSSDQRTSTLTLPIMPATVSSASYQRLDHAPSEETRRNRFPPKQVPSARAPDHSTELARLKAEIGSEQAMRIALQSRNMQLETRIAHLEMQADERAAELASLRSALPAQTRSIAQPDGMQARRGRPPGSVNKPKSVTDLPAALPEAVPGTGILASDGPVPVKWWED